MPWPFLRVMGALPNVAVAGRAALRRVPSVRVNEASLPPMETLQTLKKLPPVIWTVLSPGTPEVGVKLVMTGFNAAPAGTWISTVTSSSRKLVARAASSWLLKERRIVCPL